MQTLRGHYNSTTLLLCCSSLIKVRLRAIARAKKKKKDREREGNLEHFLLKYPTSRKQNGGKNLMLSGAPKNFMVPSNIIRSFKFVPPLYSDILQ